MIHFVNPFTANNDYNRFYSVWLSEQITVIGNKRNVYNFKFENVCFQIAQKWVIFTPFKLWVAVATHNFEWVKI